MNCLLWLQRLKLHGRPCTEAAVSPFRAGNPPGLFVPLWVFRGEDVHGAVVTGHADEGRVLVEVDAAGRQTHSGSVLPPQPAPPSRPPPPWPSGGRPRQSRGAPVAPVGAGVCSRVCPWLRRWTGLHSGDKEGPPAASTCHSGEESSTSPAALPPQAPQLGWGGTCPAGGALRADPQQRCQAPWPAGTPSDSTHKSRCLRTDSNTARQLRRTKPGPGRGPALPCRIGCPVATTQAAQPLREGSSSDR